jgi:hypothetical protein
MPYRYAFLALLCFVVAAPLQAQLAPREAAMAKLEELKERQERLVPAQLQRLIRAPATPEVYRSSAMHYRIGVRTDHTHDGATWQPADEFRYAYQDGHLRSERVYSREGGTWVIREQTLYSYQGGLLTAIEWQYAEGDQTLTPGWRTLITYSQGNISEMLSQDWEGEAWVNSYRTRFIYEGGVLVRAEEDDWTGTAWQLEWRMLVAQVGSDLVLTEQSLNGDWRNVDRITIHNVSAAQLLDPDVWFGTEQTGSPFLAMRATPTMTFETWEGGAWHFEFRTRWVIDTANNVEYLYNESWEDGAWHGMLRVAYHLGAGGRVVRSEWQYLDEEWDDEERFIALAANEVWVSFMIETYQYDAQGLLASSEAMISVGEFSMPLWRSTYQWVQVAVSTDEDASPLAYRLEAPFPNPLSGTATLRYHIDAGGHVSLRVFDVTGRIVATLTDEVHAPGRYEVSFDAGGLASGTYFLRIDGPGGHHARAITVVR